MKNYFEILKFTEDKVYEAFDKLGIDPTPNEGETQEINASELTRAPENIVDLFPKNPNDLKPIRVGQVNRFEKIVIGLEESENPIIYAGWAKVADEFDINHLKFGDREKLSGHEDRLDSLLKRYTVARVKDKEYLTK